MPAQWGIQADGLKQLSKDLRRLQDSTLSKNLRAALKKGGQLVADDAKARSSWSNRIPGSIKVSVTQKGVAVKAGGDKAPHAAIYESGGRHPVFGNRSAWVNVEKRPYLMPAGESKVEQVVDVIGDAMEDAFRENGWH